MSAKKNHNDFMEAHPKRQRLFAQVSAKAPPTTDRKGKKLPTPSKLLEDWCRKNLVGEWTSDSETNKGQRAVMLYVAAKDDVERLTIRFGASREADRGPNKDVIRLHYIDSNYRALAKELGYAV